MNRLLTVALTVLLVGSMLSACNEPYDKQVDLAYFKQYHDDMIQSYLSGDVNWFLQNMAEEQYVVADGNVRQISKAESSRNFQALFENRIYTEYKSLYGPVVQISDDGSLAWVIEQVQTKGESKTTDGAVEPFEFTSAWISTFAKVDGTWVMTGTVSNYKQ